MKQPGITSSSGLPSVVLSRLVTTFLTMALGLALAACTLSPKSSGVVDLGGNQYRVTAQGTLGVPTESRKLALLQADQFCAARRQAMQVTETGKAPLAGPYEVTFACLTNEDPEGTSPALKRPAAQVQPVR